MCIIIGISVSTRIRQFDFHQLLRIVISVSRLDCTTLRDRFQLTASGIRQRCNHTIRVGDTERATITIITIDGGDMTRRIRDRR